MPQGFDYEEFRENLIKLEGRLRLSGHGFNVEDPVLEAYFQENEGEILAYLTDEFLEGDTEEALDTLELLGYDENDLFI